MTRFLVPILFATVAAAPALAAPVVTHTRFSDDGIDYVATISTEDGVQTIAGREVASGKPFWLRVAKGVVTGNYAGAAVSFRTLAAHPQLASAAR